MRQNLDRSICSPFSVKIFILKMFSANKEGYCQEWKIDKFILEKQIGWD
jgi:hypothetical protein